MQMMMLFNNKDHVLLFANLLNLLLMVLVHELKLVTVLKLFGLGEGLVR